MTALAERTPEMSVTEFETIASAAPETVTLEFVGGRLVVKRGPDGDRSTVVARLARHGHVHEAVTSVTRLSRK
ncbi:hypothetical protein [Streptomyces sp. NBC_01538]|uniref:hypothetical protein n=1 Tax=Streptomyces sp. NBC_01538 TaxID=2903897 RepID=UPI00386836C4